MALANWFPNRNFLFYNFFNKNLENLNTYFIYFIQNSVNKIQMFIKDNIKFQ